jgi:hypothetical protein
MRFVVSETDDYLKLVRFFEANGLEFSAEEAAEDIPTDLVSAGRLQKRKKQGALSAGAYWP